MDIKKVDLAKPINPPRKLSEAQSTLLKQNPVLNTFANPSIGGGIDKLYDILILVIKHKKFWTHRKKG
jgi:hypothetical protein